MLFRNKSTHRKWLRRLNDFSKFFRRGSLPWRTSCEVNPTMSLFCRRCGSRGTMTLSRTPCHMCLLSGMKFNWKMLSSKFATNLYMFAMPQPTSKNSQLNWAPVNPWMTCCAPSPGWRRFRSVAQALSFWASIPWKNSHTSHTRWEANNCSELPWVSLKLRK